MRILVAAGVSVAGTVMVFGVLMTMNSAAEAPTEATGERAIAMQVAPKPDPPKRKPKPKPKPTPNAPRPMAPPPPTPNMAGGLASVSLGMPSGSFEMDDSATRQLLGDVKTSVMTEDAVDSKPKPVRRTSASYPPRARAKGVTGFVTMSLLIGERGGVERIKVLRADPPGTFEEAAKTAVRDWQFEPASYGGQPVKVWANQTIRFELK